MVTMLITPYFRCPLTDFTAGIWDFQSHPTCAKFEMRAIECFEAYGNPRAETKCADLVEDLHECTRRVKQIQRMQIMRQERYRQYKAGERKEHFSKVPYHDSY